MKPHVLHCLLLAALLACGEGSDPPPGEVAPPFDLARVGGGRVSLADLEGKWVLLDFWATWCAPCVLEVPELNAFYEEHRKRGVELLAIVLDGDDPAAVVEWLEENGAAYPVAVGDIDLAGEYGATAFPFHVLLSPDGRVRERLPAGYHDREELRELIARHTGG